MPDITGFHCKVCHKFNRVLDPEPPNKSSGFGPARQTSHPCIHCGSVRYYEPDEVIDSPRAS
jgi:hypothetical protein